MGYVIRAAVAIAIGSSCAIAQTPEITGIAVSSNTVRLEWQPPTNKYIIEEFSSLLDASLCTASSTGTVDSSTSVSTEGKTQVFYRVRFGLEVFQFPDPNLHQGVLLSLNPKYPPVNEIYDIELPQAQSLSVRYMAVSNLVGMERCTSLVSLELEGNDIAGLAPLSGISTLENLNLYNNSISDVSELAALTGLGSLSLGANFITDISPLSGFTNLWGFWLTYNDEVTDISPVTNMTRLTSLSIRANHATNWALIPASLPDLKHLDLEDCNIASVAPLATATQLESLNLGYNKITDIGPLTSLTELRQYWMSYNDEVTDVSPLTNMTKLTEVSIRANHATNWALLPGALPELKRLDLEDCNISNAAPLAAATQLDRLNVGFNRITDITPLSGLTDLKWFYMSYNEEVTDISPVTNMTKLTDLSIRHNAATNWGLIPSSLQDLVNLDLEACNISDLSPLTAAPQIVTLNLSFNEVSDTMPLAGLTNLTQLSIYYNPTNTPIDLTGVVSNAAAGGLGPGDTLNLDESAVTDTNDVLTLRAVYGVNVIWP